MAEYSYQKHSQRCSSYQNALLINNALCMREACSTPSRNQEMCEASLNADLLSIYSAASKGKSIRVDKYTSTRSAIQDIRCLTEDRIRNHVPTQSTLSKPFGIHITECQKGLVPRARGHATMHVELLNTVAGKISFKEAGG